MTVLVHFSWHKTHPFNKPSFILGICSWVILNICLFTVLVFPSLGGIQFCIYWLFFAHLFHNPFKFFILASFSLVYFLLGSCVSFTVYSFCPSHLILYLWWFCSSLLLVFWILTPHALSPPVFYHLPWVLAFLLALFLRLLPNLLCLFHGEESIHIFHLFSVTVLFWWMFYKTSKFCKFHSFFTLINIVSSNQCCVSSLLITQHGMLTQLSQ